MYEPEHKSKFYLIIFAAFATIVAWVIINYYKPVVIEAGCSEMASGSSSILGRNLDSLNVYNYDNIKEQCLNDLNK